MSKTNWVIILNPITKNEFKNSEVINLIKALEGKVYIISDYEYFCTSAFLQKYGMLKYVSAIFERGKDLSLDPKYLPTISEKMKIRNRDRCIYLDICTQGIVSAKLLGWNGCLIMDDKNLKKKERKKHRCKDNLGGTWYNTRFNTLKEGLFHYLFGTV